MKRSLSKRRLVIGMLTAGIGIIHLLPILSGQESAQWLFADCGFFRSSGKPCPSCGMTRALQEMGQWNLQSAWTHNYNAVLLYFSLLVSAATLMATEVGIFRRTPRGFLLSIAGLCFASGLLNWSKFYI